MWDGVTYVEPNYAPIVHEGKEPVVVVATNAGPATVRLQSWNMPKPGSDVAPDVDMELRAGNTRSISGNLVRLRANEASPLGEYKEFAAVGWRIEK